MPKLQALLITFRAINAATFEQSFPVIGVLFY